jgi:hydroxyethylthiazole kinase
VCECVSPPACPRACFALEAQKHRRSIASPGATDIITDGARVWGVDNGVELLTRVTAAGCSLTALIAAFLAAAPVGGGKDAAMEAAAAGLSVFG